MNDDPLSQLVFQHQNEKTVLDEHLMNSIALKNEKNNTSHQTKDHTTKKTKGNGKEEEEDNDQPIGLVHRQPSYTSLHGPLIGKDGVKVDMLPDLKEEGEETNMYHHNFHNDAPKPNKEHKKSKNSSKNSFTQDNVVAFDKHDVSEDVPIGLTYRQPSFSSLGDHLISKAGDSIADMDPLQTIPIEEAIIEEENADAQNANEEEADFENEEDEEDEENPQVQIVKDLKQKNKERWLKMGYEPPPNLIQLTRAQSQSVFNQNQVLMQPTPNMPPAFSPLIEEEEVTNLNNNKNNLDSINNKITAPTTTNTTNSNTQSKSSNQPNIVHRRCGSNGMKLGEASTSLARMSQALMIYDSNSKFQDGDDEENDVEKVEYEEEEEAGNEFEEDEKVDSPPEKENKKEKGTKHKEQKHKDKSKSKNKDKSKSKEKNKSIYKLKKKSKDKSDSDSEDDYSYPVRDVTKKNRNYLFSSSSSSRSDYDSDVENDGNYYYHRNDELFGKLGQIVKEDESSDVYKAILYGKLPRSNKSNKQNQTKLRIQHYINICINNLWIDETSYLTNIIDASDKQHHHHHHSSIDNNFGYNSYHHEPERPHHYAYPHDHHHHRGMKNISPIESLKIRAAEEDANYETKIQETFLKQKHMLEMLNDEFREAANDLDAQYAVQSSSRSPFTGNWSPSPAVLELRETIKQLLKAKKYSAVQELSAKLKKLEMNEAREVSEMIHEQYLNADRLLKERFAMRRALLNRKIQFELKALKEERHETAKRYSKSISRLRNFNLEMNESYDLADDDYGYDDYSDRALEYNINDFADDKLLPVMLPQRISRENDEKIIELMADKIMALNSSSDGSEDNFSSDYKIEKKKKKDKKKKDKKKDKKKKDKKKDKKRKDK